MRRKQPQTKNTGLSTKGSNQLRIIGGQWRGRKLSFPDQQGLRPTPDRVRETLFNWIAPDLIGARCLDLFSGSGALGFEALSRGARHTDLVDSAAIVTRQLKDNARLLNCAEASIHQTNAAAWLATEPEAYDIIFLDPPFHRGLADDCIALIDSHQLIKQRGWVYLEMAKDETPPTVPSNWRLHREKNAGQVSYRLFAVDAAAQS